MSKNLLTAALMTDVRIAVTDVQKKTTIGTVEGVRREGGKGYYLVTVATGKGVKEVCVKVS